MEQHEAAEKETSNSFAVKPMSKDVEIYAVYSVDTVIAKSYQFAEARFQTQNTHAFIHPLHISNQFGYHFNQS